MNGFAGLICCVSLQTKKPGVFVVCVLILFFVSCPSCYAQIRLNIYANSSNGVALWQKAGWGALNKGRASKSRPLLRYERNKLHRRFL